MSKPQPSARPPLPEAGSLWRWRDSEEFAYSVPIDGIYHFQRFQVSKGDLALILNADRCVVTMLINGSKFQDDIWSFHENFVPLINEEVSSECKR